MSFSFILSSGSGMAQGGFNYRIAIEASTAFQSVHVSSGGSFVIAGWSVDLTGNGHLDFELLKYSFSGDSIQRSSFDNPQCFGYSAEGTKSFVDDLFVQFESTNVDGTYSNRLYWFDQNMDTLFTKIVQSPYKDSLWDDADFMYSQYAVLAKDSCLFYSFGVWKPETTGNDVCIQQYSPTGELLWTYIYATDAEVDACYALLPQDDGGVIAALYETGINGNPSINRITRINNQGVENWSFDYPGGFQRTLINSIIQDDGKLIISGRNYSINQPIGGTLPIIMKLDTLGNLDWYDIHGTELEDIQQDYTNVVQTCDSNYVAGGTWISWPGSEEIIEGQNNPDYDEFAHIVKFERNTGDILWERKYRFLEIYRDQHTLVDMKSTPDGGVIFCGEARDAYHIYDPPYQQGWLVKLDECGCLVPGCDTLCKYVCNVPTDTTDSTFFPVFNSHFIIGPNPANDFINIYFGPSPTLPQGKGVVFEIHDVQGKLVYSFVPTTTETTYMMSTEILAAGMYVISLRNGDKVLQQQKVIVEK